MIWPARTDEASAEVERSLGEYAASAQEVRKVALDQVSAAHRVAVDYDRDRFARAVDAVTRQYREAHHRDP